MLRLKDRQMSLLDEWLPPALRKLPAELEVIDDYLDDERFLAPFVERFDEVLGRPTVPVEVYLRMMYLKHRNDWGYEHLVQAVYDSFQLRLFCHISLEGKVPHYSTLVKLTHKYGEDMCRTLHEEVVKKMAEEKLLPGRAMRTDTTVMEANIEHPTDADLLSDCMRLIGRTMKGIGKIVPDLTQGYRPGTRVAKKILWAIGAKLKSRAKDIREVVQELTGNMKDEAKRVHGQAKKVLERIKTPGQLSAKKLRKLKKLIEKLQDALGITQMVIDQTLLRLAGQSSIPNRIVSIFDREARAIVRGKLSKPVEFGYKVRFDEVEGGVVSRYEVYVGNPADVTMLQEAVKLHRDLFGHVPTKVATDKGFTSQENEAELKRLGVKQVSTPVRGKRSKKREAIETTRWFRDLQRWRAGSEATISRLKRLYGVARTYLRGHAGASIWVGFCTMVHNLVRMVKLRAQAAS